MQTRKPTSRWIMLLAVLGLLLLYWLGAVLLGSLGMDIHLTR